MSTKVSIAGTGEWELFRRMWDAEVVRVRADVAVHDGGCDDSDDAPRRDVTIVLPKRWLLEMAKSLAEHGR